MAKRCDFLKKCSFLEPLTNEQISKVAGALEVTTYEAGSHILRQGEHGTSFFIIEEGSVQCTQIKASGREIELM
jgi:CRP-like cAMP-binding protein